MGARRPRLPRVVRTMLRCIQMGSELVIISNHARLKRSYTLLECSWQALQENYCAVGSGPGSVTIVGNEGPSACHSCSSVSSNTCVTRVQNRDTCATSPGKQLMTVSVHLKEQTNKGEARTRPGHTRARVRNIALSCADWICKFQ